MEEMQAVQSQRPSLLEGGRGQQGKSTVNKKQTEKATEVIAFYQQFQ